jgi:DNA-binding transcriptional LysR family regulator
VLSERTALDIDLNLLTVFDAIMTELSLTRAAKRLDRTQSAVSHSLKRLRELTGDPLFERTGTGVRPTPRALEMEKEVRRALSMIQAALGRRESFDPQRETRTFFVDIPAGFDWLVAPKLAECLRSTPGITVRIANARAANMLNELRNRETWLALDYTPLHIEGYKSEALIDDEVVLIARPGHPLLENGVTADNVRKVRQVGIGWSAVSVPTPHPIDDRVQEAGLPRNVQLWVPTLSSMVAVVAGSDFVAYMARGAAGRFAETYGIALHRLPFELRPLPMIMVWHESFEADCGHRWLRDTIRDICRSI